MVKFKYVIITILFCTIGAYAQSDNLSISLSYPIPMGENNFEQHSGTIDIGVKYRFLEKGTFNFGGSLNLGFYQQNIKQNNYERRTSLLQPIVFAELKGKSFRPFMGLGYTFLHTNQEFGPASGITGFIPKFDWSGLNANIGASIDILPKLFLAVQYDYTKLSSGKNLPDVDHITNVSILKIGAGMRF